ncbi:glutamic-type intramembrane protease PrsW [Effusibacillus pohliae]|uniref:glutamic-type intramembrane protease PrsW n=1 Tax=Effusibacillus pohliae TaxID=232270 RepID=UPI00035EEDE6|nr:glutamic-type intramembrane protease PrsW [Effusibacillus pohliae]
MILLMIAVAAIAPGIALLSYFYLRDRYEAEPLRTVLWSFALGMVSVLPVTVLQQLLEQLVESPYLHILLVAAGIEEAVKFVILLLFIRTSKEVNELYDGILYAVAISLGFATVENFVSLLPHGWQLAAIRAVLPVPSHALFAVVMGYYAGKAKFSHAWVKFRLLCQSFFSAWLLHAAYDLILSGRHLWQAAMLPFMIGLWILGLRKVKAAQDKSPFKPQD